MPLNIIVNAYLQKRHSRSQSSLVGRIARHVAILFRGKTIRYQQEQYGHTHRGHYGHEPRAVPRRARVVVLRRI